MVNPPCLPPGPLFAIIYVSVAAALFCLSKFSPSLLMKLSCLRNYVDGLRIKIDKKQMTDIILISAFFTIAIMFTVCKIGPDIENSVFSLEGFVYTVLIGPFGEEVLYRGILLNAVIIGMLFVFNKMKMDEHMEKLKFLVIFTICVLMSVPFAESHINTTSQQWIARILGGVFYSLVYFHFNRNLTLAFAAHSTNNLLIYMLGTIHPGWDICRFIAPFLF